MPKVVVVNHPTLDGVRPLWRAFQGGGGRVGWSAVVTATMEPVPMREDCRHFESRAYDSGEVARFCVLGLAPEAPWRCPDDCSRYEPTLIDGTFETVELSRPPVEDEPDDTPDNIEGVLADAEAIVEAAEPDAIRDAETSGRAGSRRRWWQVRKPRPGPGDDDEGFSLSNR